jgi:outer membrane protein
MKRQLLFAALLVIGFNASAQFTKGEKVLGGNLSFSTSKYDDFNPPTNRFSIGAGLGFVKSEKKIVGASLSYAYSTYNNTLTSSANSNSVFAGVYVQNIKNIKGNLFGFLYNGLSSGYYKQRYLDSNPSSSYSSNGFTFGANSNLGIGYRISKRFVANMTLTNLISLQYTQDKRKIDASNATSKNSSFSISSGLTSFSLNNTAIGFSWVFQ